MAGSKSRGATKQLGHMNTGARTIQFRVNKFTRCFTVHEDVIYRTSGLFKDRLQKNRKPLFADANPKARIDKKKFLECYICHECLDPVVDDITFCVNCGQNVHEECIEAWKKKGRAECPMCRKACPNSVPAQLLDMEEEVEASAMQSYLDWLYSGEVRIDKVVDRRLGNKNVAILKCWAVALAVKDDAFKDAIEDVFREEARECYEQDMVRWHLQATISIQKREVLLSTTSLKV